MGRESLDRSYHTDNMTIRYLSRSTVDDSDPEQGRRNVFPGDGSTLGSPSGMKRDPSSKIGGDKSSTSIETNSVRFSKLILVCTVMLSIVAIRAALQTQYTNILAPPNMLLQSESASASASVLSSDARVGNQQTLNRLIEAVKNAPVGSLGPSGTNRKHMRYYDTLFYTTLQYGADAKSIIEVGCASDPFLRHLGWIDERTCVAPYFVEYGKDSDKLIGIDHTTEIKKVTADFMEYQLPNDEKFDLLLCNQVLEHVPDPASFMMKLIASAKTSVISVPYKWGPCGKTCNHKTNHITMDTLKKWSAPHIPIYQKVVEEEGYGGNRKRAIVVFETS